VGEALEVIQKSAGQVKDEGDTWEITLKLVEQLEARVRELEGAVFDGVMEAADKERVVNSKAAAKAYADAVAKSPKEHGLGPPHVHQMAACMAILANKSHEGLDPAVSAKLLALQCLNVILDRQSLSEACSWVKSFRVTDLNEKGKHAGKVRVVWHLRGEVRLPPVKHVQGILDKVTRAAGDKDKIYQVAEEHVVSSNVDVPAAAEAEGKIVGIQALLTSFLAQEGAIRFDSKAPRGGLAYELHMKNSKGKK